MNIEDIKKYIEQRKLNDIDPYDANSAKREHLKRQYLRLHHMERKIQDYKKLKEITRMKRQLLKFISRN